MAWPLSKQKSFYKFTMLLWFQMDTPLKKAKKRRHNASIFFFLFSFPSCSNNLQKELTGFRNKQIRECEFIIRKMAVCRPSLTFQRDAECFRSPVGLEGQIWLEGWSVESWLYRLRHWCRWCNHRSWCRTLRESHRTHGAWAECASGLCLRAPRSPPFEVPLEPSLENLEEVRVSWVCRCPQGLGSICPAETGLWVG